MAAGVSVHAVEAIGREIVMLTPLKGRLYVSRAVMAQNSDGSESGLGLDDRRIGLPPGLQAIRFAGSDRGTVGGKWPAQNARRAAEGNQGGFREYIENDLHSWLVHRLIPSLFNKCRLAPHE